MPTIPSDCPRNCVEGRYPFAKSIAGLSIFLRKLSLSKECLLSFCASAFVLPTSTFVLFPSMAIISAIRKQAFFLKNTTAV